MLGILLVEKSVKYLKSRLSQNTEFIIDNNTNKLYADVNKTLLEWVIENICKNSSNNIYKNDNMNSDNIDNDNIDNDNVE